MCVHLATNALSSSQGGEPDAIKEKVPLPPGGEPKGVLGDVDGKKLLANGSTGDDDSMLTKSVGTPADLEQQLRAVANNTVSSTVVEQVVIPNPHSILTQLDQSTRSQAADSATEATNLAAVSSAAANTPLTNSSTVSLSSDTSVSTATPPTKRSANNTHQTTHSETGPENLCAATLPTSLSTSASESSPIAVSGRTKAKPSNFFLCILFCLQHLVVFLNGHHLHVPTRCR